MNSLQAFSQSLLIAVAAMVVLFLGTISLAICRSSRATRGNRGGQWHESPRVSREGGRLGAACPVIETFTGLGQVLLGHESATKSALHRGITHPLHCSCKRPLTLY
jgi:hypothetical protein